MSQAVQKISASEFIKRAIPIVARVENAVKSGVRGEELNRLVNEAIGEIKKLTERLEVTEEDIKTRGTVAMKHVYEDFKDSPAVVEDLRKGVANKLKTMFTTRMLSAVLEPELEPYARELADVLVDAHKRGGLEAAADAAYEYFRSVKYGGRRLVGYLFTEGPDSLQHAPRTMQKFSRTALETCPGADVCAAQCYALHGNYVQLQTKRAIAARDVFVDLLKKELLKRLNSDPALTAGLLGAAFAGGVKAAGFGEVVRLHDAGDFSDEKYLAAWLVAAKLLPDRQIYTYTKTFPNIPGMPPVWQNAVRLYRALFGEREPLPQNFNVNVSATATNYKYIAGAAEALTKLGMRVPGVFFYASANMDEYYRGREERWRELAKELVEAAKRTTGKRLVLEFEHGLSAGRSAKSSRHIVRLVGLIADYAEKSGIPLKISVSKTAYRIAELKDEEKRRLLSLPPGERDQILLDLEKLRMLNEIAAKLAEKYEKEEPSGEPLTWTRTVTIKEEGAGKAKKNIEIKLKRPIETFVVPGVGEPVEVFIEPGGEKVCTLCQRCIFAEHSLPKKDVFKIRLTAPTIADVPTPQPAETATTIQATQRRAGRRKKATAT